MTIPSDHRVVSGIAAGPLGEQMTHGVRASRRSAFLKHSAGRIVCTAALPVLLVLVLCSAPFAVGHAFGAGKYASIGDSGQKREKATTELVEGKILRFTNEERAQRGLARLRPSRALEFMAKTHSNNMCRTRSLEHESRKFPKGWRTFGGRLKRVGLGSGAENIGYRGLHGSSDRWAEQMVKGWMNSPSHRKNILDPRFRYLGVGIRPCANKLGYATQVFSRRSGKVR